MACPYFYPVVRSQTATAPARAPLGALYEGYCQAVPHAPLHESCNFGYGRSCCTHFPLVPSGDAVRFTTTAEGKLLYVIETNYSPSEHGSADSPHLPGAIRRQAEVFLENWKRFV
ncbi:MAG TPA: hypothetical protein VMZ52_08265 [Bryobacteraceae bacterium]|nr:hypothetical protein [Bryobacteraceae bacterium]